MSHFISKTIHRFSKLFRVYVAIGLAATIITLIYGALAQYSTLSVWVCVIFIFGYFIKKIMYGSKFSYYVLATKNWLPDYQKVFPPEPPWFPKFLLYLLLPSGNEEILADLGEEYITLSRKFGEPRAVLWFWKQVLVSIIPLLKWRLRHGFSDSFFPTVIQDDVKDYLPFYRRKAFPERS